jgi:hypothetical protein
VKAASRFHNFPVADDPGTNSSWHESYSPSGSKGSFPQERQVNEILEEWNLPWSNLDSMVCNHGKYKMCGIDFPRAFGLAWQTSKKISVGKWLRLIERGFAQAENNHFKPLIRGVPEP